MLLIFNGSIVMRLNYLLEDGTGVRFDHYRHQIRGETCPEAPNSIRTGQRRV